MIWHCSSRTFYISQITLDLVIYNSTAIFFNKIISVFWHDFFNTYFTWIVNNLPYLNSLLNPWADLSKWHNIENVNTWDIDRSCHENWFFMLCGSGGIYFHHDNQIIIIRFTWNNKIDLKQRRNYIVWFGVVINFLSIIISIITLFNF